MKNPMRKKLTSPQIFETTCKRCGKIIYASPRAFEHPLGRICKDCITPEESQEILDYQAGQIMKRMRKNPKRALTNYNLFVQKSIPYYTSQGLSVPDAMRASARDWYYGKKGIDNPNKGKYQTIGYFVLGGIALFLLYKKFIEKK